MTNTIMKSLIAPYPIPMEDAKAAFGRLVDAHIEKLKIWSEHHDKVRAQGEASNQPRPAWEDFAGRKNPKAEFEAAVVAWNNSNLERYEPYPRDESHPQIEASILETKNQDGSTSFEPDFEIVNDDPAPEFILSEKRNTLHNRVAQAEHLAIEEIHGPLGKRRKELFREASIIETEGKLAADFLKKEIEAKAKDPGYEPQDVALLVSGHRAPDDAEFLANLEASKAKVRAIQESAINAMIEIDDLTLENIDKFEIPSFDL